MLFRISNKPVVKVYHGFGNSSQIIVFGHVFKLSPLPRTKFNKNFWTNTFALFRSFMVKGVVKGKVVLKWGDKEYTTYTATDGFFRFEFHPETPMLPGTYPVQVDYVKELNGIVHHTISGIGSLYVPHNNTYFFVSDIDDTFLISHSANVWRKLYVLLTKNAHSRKPFAGVVNHYQLLANALCENNTSNPFFYVSSSEWNLYDFIKEFCRKNKMPEGVFFLSQIKKLTQLWKTGGGKHGAKFMCIVRILEAYPQQKFVLLGDDSQQDPIIYDSIVSHFPDRIAAVYLRHVHEKNISNVNEKIANMKKLGIPVCHFVHSAEAIQHSATIGLIASTESVHTQMK